MVPLIELRGAIPVGAGMGLEFLPNYLVSVVGNILPVPFILLLIRYVLDFMKEKRIFPKFVDWLERKAVSGKKKIMKGSDLQGCEGTVEKQRLGWGALVGLFLFVALPLPGTGAWSGSLVAALFKMNRLASFFVIFAGVLVAGLLMSLASYGVVGALSFIL
jgi:uncharacterized membrane protein